MKLGKCEVEYLDSMGGDHSIVDAARVSYNKDRNIERDLSDEDVKLINYLIKHGHWSPFEMGEIKVRVTAPLAIARQWFRHTGSYNEISLRYTSFKELNYHLPDIMRMSHPVNKQSSVEVSVEDSESAKDIFTQAYKTCEDAYLELIRRGVAKEIARLVLPTSTFTKFIYKTNLRNMLFFLKSRCGEDAQLEIRDLANQLKEIVSSKFPVCSDLFWEYNKC